MTNSITFKLIATLTLCLSLIIGGALALDYRLSRAEILTRLQQEAIETVDNVVVDLDNWLSGVESTTLFLGRVLAQREYSEAGLEQLLRDIVEQNDDIYGATIALDLGKTANNSGFAPYYYKHNNSLRRVDLVPQRYWEQDWYVKAVETQQPAWVEPYFDAGGGEILMTTFSVPIYHQNTAAERTLYAVVTADIALTELHQYLQRLRLGNRGFGIMLSRQGLILSAPNPDSIMQHHTDVAQQALDLSKWQVLVDKALSGETVNRQIGCPHLFGECMVRLTALASTGWPVGVVYAEDEILAPLYQYQLKTAMLGLFALVLMALVVSVVARRITKPLVALASVTDQIAQGMLDVPLPRAGAKDEVGRLIAAFAAMKLNLRTYIADLEQATAARSRLQGELATASQIQMAMLPQHGNATQKSDYLELWATIRPAKTVGGDLYTYFRDAHNRLYFCVGDVSDKGVPAALFMAKTISHIQQFFDDFIDPAKGMAHLNDALESGNSNCMFVTLFFGVLELETGLLRFSSAGHTAPSLVRAGKATSLDQDTGPALGLAANLSFPTNELQLQPGDRLAVYTDGIDEAFNTAGDMYGIEHFNEGLQNSWTLSLADSGRASIEAIDAFSGDCPQSDDIALLLIEYTGSVALHLAEQTFTAGPALASRVASWLETTLLAEIGDPAVLMEIILVSEEVVTNIEKYAGLENDQAIEISVRSCATHIDISYADQGVAFNPLIDAQKAGLGEETPSAKIGGLGVHLITRLTESQSYQRVDRRNILTLSKRLANDEAESN